MAIEIESYKMLKIDSKGRISLGRLVREGTDSYKAYLDKKTNQIILEPYAEVPLKEAWLFKNKSVLKQVYNGIKQSAEEKNKIYWQLPTTY